jgi:hypothetical protein
LISRTDQSTQFTTGSASESSENFAQLLSGRISFSEADFAINNKREMGKFCEMDKFCERGKFREWHRLEFTGV